MKQNTLKYFLQGTIRQNLEQWGDRPALRFCGETYSYQQLLTLTDNLLAYISANTALGDDVVVQTCSTSPMRRNLFNILLGIAGIPYEPLSLEEPEERSRIKAAKWQRLILLTDRETLPVIKSVSSQAVLVIITDDVVDFDFVLSQDQERSNTIDLSHYFYILSTSGSTGEPKSVPILHENLYAYLHAGRDYFDIREPMVFSQIHDVCFDFNIHEVYLALFTHSTICIAERSDLLSPTSVGQFIERNNISFWSCVPSLINHLNHLYKYSQTAFDQIEKTMICGEPLTMELYRAWKKMAPNSRIHNVYGPTECTVAVSGKDITEYEKDDVKNDVFTIGKPYNNVLFYVLKDGEICQYGEGELLVGGPQVFDGYLSGITLMRDCLLESPDDNGLLYRTGDNVLIEEGKPIYFISRGDDQLQIRGHRIQKSEIVNTIRNTIPCANLAIVEKLTDKGTVSGIVLFISGVAMNEVEIRRQLAVELPGYALPLKINIGPIPMNKNMKNDYKKLYAMVNSDPIAQLDIA